MRSSPQSQLSLPLIETSRIHNDAARFAELAPFDGVRARIVDIPETIPQLGYGSHQFFRYYGKFPSVLGRLMIARFASPGDFVGDCYVGSGTTLVEAQIQGCPSIGLDINPLAVFASNVKTRYYDHAQLEREIPAFMKRVKDIDQVDLPTTMTGAKLDKWFAPSVQSELGRIRYCLLAEAGTPNPVHDFLTLAFLAIVRRVSNAYDGEVRPHINPDKSMRSAVRALEKKIADMLCGLTELDRMRPTGIACQSVVGDNRDYRSMISVTSNRKIDFMVAHPPYLNSFNYLPVFGHELAWAQGFPAIWGSWNLRDMKDAEHTAWPATTESVIVNYYADFTATARAAQQALAPGGVLAVVVGDATIRGVLEPVHVRMWNILRDQGMVPEEIWFRTTHYGIGKYAYSTRADYHGDAEKKDAVMFFRNPA